MSRIQYNPKSIRRIVAQMVLDTRDFLCCERELECRRPQVEREHVGPRRQSVECWQSGVLFRNYRGSPSQFWGSF